MTLLHQKRQGLLAPDNLLPLFVVVSLVLGVLNLLMILGLVFSTARMANRPVPRLVQLVDGRSVLTEPIANMERSPEAIRLFTKNTLTMMFTWNAVSQVQDAAGVSHSTMDAGVDAGGELATTKSWQASFALSEDFRGPFLQAVGQMTPDDVFQGKAQSVLNVTTLSEPLAIGDGEWVLEVVASLIIFDQSTPRGRAIPFNKKIYVRAIEPSFDPLVEDATPIQRAVYQVRAAGLEITEIHELLEE
ncbi:MAG: hypothetical protein F6K00_33665 [Leptolyngbya sp. SIOISBB]|nr:hypothetical protein [Leptolyngbya sp. SIOISBB]